MAGLNDAFLSVEELQQLGFQKLGRNVLVHRTAVIVEGSAVSIADHVRIDPFCVLSAKRIDIGSYTHVSSHSALLGRAQIFLEEFVNISPGTRILTSNDDFSGRSLVGPMVPEAFNGAHHADVIIRRHGLIGAGSIILPGVTIGEGSSVGALSFVNCSLDAWGVYAGVPVRRIRDRSRDITVLAEELLSSAERSAPAR
jgi:galactoside O-acetyltransferase